MSLEFQGIKLMPILDLGVSQLYLNKKKLDNIYKWFCPEDTEKYPSLPVHDFGDGKYTLTDGHSRAYVAYNAGVALIPVVYDTDEIVVSDIGLLQYRNDIEWCKRHEIFTVADFENRIIPDEQYKKLWIERCDKSYNLLSQTTEDERKALNDNHGNLYLYGANEDLGTLYFESSDGKVFEFKNK